VTTTAQPERSRLERIFNRYYWQVWRMLRRLGVPSAHTDDAAQEVFLVVHQKLAVIAEASEKHYLFSTALRIAANQRRSRARRLVIAGDVVDAALDELPGADQLLEQKRRRELLDGALDALGESQRDVFVLFELEGLSVPEIAELYDVPVGTVASRLRRARLAFETALLRRRRRSDFDQRYCSSMLSGLRRGDAEPDAAPSREAAGFGAAGFPRLAAARARARSADSGAGTAAASLLGAEAVVAGLALTADAAGAVGSAAALDSRLGVGPLPSSTRGVARVASPSARPKTASKPRTAMATRRRFEVLAESL
jgi:RNA polymerase sigma-70 factor, ECF subfamily